MKSWASLRWKPPVIPKCEIFRRRYILQRKPLWISTILDSYFLAVARNGMKIQVFTHEESFMCQNVFRFNGLWHKFWFCYVCFFFIFGHWLQKPTTSEKTTAINFRYFHHFVHRVIHLWIEKNCAAMQTEIRTRKQNFWFRMKKKSIESSSDTRTHARTKLKVIELNFR